MGASPQTPRPHYVRRSFKWMLLFMASYLVVILELTLEARILFSISWSKTYNLDILRKQW
jgi:hypothetical protein